MVDAASAWRASRRERAARSVQTPATMPRSIALVLLALAPVACAVQGGTAFDGDYLGDGSGGSGGGKSNGAGSGSGGKASSAGQTSASNGAGGSAPKAPPKCPYDGVPIDPAALGPACPASVCAGGGHCLPDALIQAQDPAELDKLADCDAKNKCVPDFFVKNQGLFIPPSCASVFGAEGRCLSTCLPDVAKHLNDLPQSSCAPNERCLPCYDPFTLQPTGACDLSCDPGPQKPPQPLPKCCDNMGTCVPKASVPPAEAAKLGDCAQPKDAKCVPDVFLNDPNYKGAPCKPSLLAFLFGNDYASGVCLPGCLPDLKESLFVKQESCPDGFRCAPCFKPGIFGPKPTGACGGS